MADRLRVLRGHLGAGQDEPGETKQRAPAFHATRV